jgi:hypothetical protein
MSKLSTIPVLRCTHCGKMIKLTYLATTQSDADGEMLWKIFHGIAKNALCNYCQKQYNYLSKEGRLDEWHQNLILNVPDR